jgi:3-hydroxyacyl-CoA dehydrogenase / enoyl-CoA hydratase / 3-hydroxybutyryl-CoA epimerase
VLKDVTFEAAERGKEYSAKLLAKAQERGRSTPEKAVQILARITPTADVDALEGCDCVVEAIFEDPELKKKLFAEVEGVVAPDALLGSNTSTLPITDLAEGVTRQADFIGMHFFSPADKMPIVEVIRGEQTTDETLARTIDFVLQLRKIPIVVNDSRGFYTSRIIGVRINEGLAMIAEGVAPWTVERATLQAGYPVGALQLCDELNLELMAKVAAATKAGAEAEGRGWVEKPGAAVVPAMVAAGRAGRLRGAGFYDYDEAGVRQGIWAGLADLFPVAADQISFVDAQDRLLFAETLEAAKCVEEGVIESAAAANIGAIMAIGFPGITGGPATFMTNYEGGLAGFVARADALADVYGERFRPSAWLRAKAAAGEGFPA